jgi:hypothetical protein
VSLSVDEPARESSRSFSTWLVSPNPPPSGSSKPASPKRSNHGEGGATGGGGRGGEGHENHH